MIRLHPIRRISARRLHPKQSWIKNPISSIRCISSLQPFDASCSHRRHSPPQLPLHLVPQREFMAFAFRGGAALVFTLAFYVGIQVATRLPPMQRMYIRRRLGRLQRGVDVTADTGKLTLNRPEKFGFFDNILSRAPAGPLVCVLLVRASQHQQFRRWSLGLRVPASPRTSINMHAIPSFDGHTFQRCLFVPV